MAPATSYLNTTIGVDSSIWDKIGLAITVLAVLATIVGVVIAYLAWRYPVVRAMTAPVCRRRHY